MIIYQYSIESFFENGAKLSYALLGTGYTLTDSDKTNLDTQIDNITGVGNRGKNVYYVYR